MKNSNTLPTASDKPLTPAAPAGRRILAIRRAPEEDGIRFPETWMVEFVEAFSHANRFEPSEQAAQAWAANYIAEDFARVSATESATTVAPAVPVADSEASAPILSTRFAPLPVGPYSPASELGDGQASAHGSCTTYCTTGHWDGKPSGMEVSEHGPWCESQARGYVRGFSELGSPRESSVSLVKRYLHGTYDYTGRQLHQQPDEFVRIEIYEQGVSIFQFLPIGEAYRLGAALTTLARSADSLDVPLDAAA